MLKLTPVYALMIILLVASLACNFSNVVTPDPNSVDTSVVQTLVAIQLQGTQSAIPISAAESATPIPTFTPETPTLSPTPTLSATPVFTGTPQIPQITVSLATNCRVGPGKAYARVGALLVGETADVYGRNPTGNYWYIRNPDSGSEFCWLWGEYAALVGNTLALPVFTPPPTPTPVPAFKASYDGLDACVGWWVEIELTNSGSVDFESISLTVKDTDTNTSLSTDGNIFTNLDGCATSKTRETLASGKRVTVSSPPFGYDPTGHKIRATITLCSNNNQKGVCITDEIKFTP
jgi:hypothetical protein